MPRFRILAMLAVVIGAIAMIAAAGLWATGTHLIIAAVGGAMGLLAGGIYLRSPAWRITIAAGPSGLAVAAGSRPKFQLAWDDIRRVVTNRETSACYIKSDSPATSILIPGPEAPAPYDIEGKAALIATVLSHVDPERIDRVDSMRVSPVPEPQAR
ncbi:MAG TPA: hypothetical protein VFG83_00215 [Kofleriaceae bacterium]|nr:hypothetical protein [Kofleriaceae bacterium]